MHMHIIPTSGHFSNWGSSELDQWSAHQAVCLQRVNVTSVWAGRAQVPTACKKIYYIYTLSTTVCLGVCVYGVETACCRCCCWAWTAAVLPNPAGLTVVGHAHRQALLEAAVLALVTVFLLDLAAALTLVVFQLQADGPSKKTLEGWGKK